MATPTSDAADANHTGIHAWSNSTAKKLRIPKQAKPTTSPPTTATIGDTTVSYDDFRRQYQSSKAQMQSLYGEQFTPELERQMGLSTDIIRFITIKVDEHEEGPSAMMRRSDRDDRGDRGDRGDRRGPRRDHAPREARTETPEPENKAEGEEKPAGEEKSE